MSLGSTNLIIFRDARQQIAQVSFCIRFHLLSGFIRLLSFRYQVLVEQLGSSVSVPFDILARVFQLDKIVLVRVSLSSTSIYPFLFLICCYQFLVN